MLKSDLSPPVEQFIIFSLLLRDEVKNRQIEEILKHRQKDQAGLVLSLLEEESWQLQAFSYLLSQRDRRTAQLKEDIKAVVDQLNQLTNWELLRKSRQMDITNVNTAIFQAFFHQLYPSLAVLPFFFHSQDVLEDNRRQLVELLSQLLEQQELRRKDLKHLLEEMEAQRLSQEADYWLVQYQRLMDTKPEIIDRAPVYLPSAPSAALEYGEATAPPVEVFMETQCVVCMDLTVSVELP